MNKLEKKNYSFLLGCIPVIIFICLHSKKYSYKLFTGVTYSTYYYLLWV